MQIKIKYGYVVSFIVFTLIASSFFYSDLSSIYAAEARINISQTGAGKTISVSRSGLFEASTLIPGDSSSGELTVFNKTGQTVFYRLKGVYGQNNSSELMKKSELKITNSKGQILYKGSFSDAYTPELIVCKGTSEKYLYSLHVPIECGNEIISDSRNIRFVYIASDRENGTLDGGNTEGGGNNDSFGGDDGGQDLGGSGGNGNSSSGEEGDSGRPGGGSSGSGGNHSSGGGSSGGGSSGGSSSGGSSSGGGQSGDSSSGGGTSGGLTGNGAVVGSGFHGSTAVGQSNSFNNHGVHNADQKAEASVYAVPDFKLKLSGYEGSWIYKDGNWFFQQKNGEYVKNGWSLINNPYGKPEPKSEWYYFDKTGRMQTGWIRCENDSWYYTNEVSDGNLGGIVTGWIENKDDGKTYYMSELNGRMLTGWNKLKDKHGKEGDYYFARLEDTYRQNWFFNTAFGRWIYSSLGGRTYGSLFKDEMTPDKKYVDKNGARIEK